MVVAYKVHPFTWFMFQWLRTVRWVSLVNLVAEREVVPEILQDRANADSLAAALRPLLDPRDPAPLLSVKDWRWFGNGWARLGRRRRVVALADELLGACG